MHKAANLDDDAEDASVSAMAEVARLQEAYYAMNDELNRIRAFVPQSVLLEARKFHRFSGRSAEHEDASEEDHDLLESLSEADKSMTVASVPVSPAAVSPAGSLGGRGQRSCSSSHSGVAAAARDAAGRGTQAVHHQMGAYSLKSSAVSVLIANTASFGPALAAAPRDTAIELTTELVASINRSVVAHGGVLASYHGDHFIATFNAAKSCASHATSAARCAVAICGEAASVGFNAPVRVGVATSRCLVGALGCKEVKAFNTVGPAFQQACVLERMCPLHAAAPGESVALATRRTWQDVQTQLRGRVVDLVQLPASTGPALLYKLLGTVQHADDEGDGAGKQGPPKKDDGNDNEWLYLVGTAEASDPFKPWNDAWEALAQGRVDAARERMACGGADAGAPPVDADGNRVVDSYSPVAAPGVKRHLERFEALCAMPAEGRGDRHSDLGEFYAAGWQR
jgi:class 3 adenylate cyclase